MLSSLFRTWSQWWSFSDKNISDTGLPLGSDLPMLIPAVMLSCRCVLWVCWLLGQSMKPSKHEESNSLALVAWNLLLAHTFSEPRQNLAFIFFHLWCHRTAQLIAALTRLHQHSWHMLFSSLFLEKSSCFNRVGPLAGDIYTIFLLWGLAFLCYCCVSKLQELC